MLRPFAWALIKKEFGNTTGGLHNQTPRISTCIEIPHSLLLRKCENAPRQYSFSIRERSFFLTRVGGGVGEQKKFM